MKRSGYHGRDTGGANLSLISFFLFLPISLYFNLFATPSFNASSSFFLLHLRIFRSRIRFRIPISCLSRMLDAVSTFPLFSPNFEKRERREYRKSKSDVLNVTENGVTSVNIGWRGRGKGNGKGREGGVFRELSEIRGGVEFVRRNERLGQDLGHMSSDPYR